MPVARRILSLWFCRLGTDQVLRREGLDPDLALAVVEDTGQRQVLSSLSPGAQAAGLYPGLPLRDAHAMCPDLLTRLRNPRAEEGLLNALRRWAGQFTPWVGLSGDDGLVLDISGCAHLFGGEAALLTRLEEDCAALGLLTRGAVADTPGGAWALARYAGVAPGSTRSGDAVDQEARATRSRAARRHAGQRRHWERGGTAPLHAPNPSVSSLSVITPGPRPETRIVPPGQLQATLAPLPIAALRLDPPLLEQLSRLGLRSIGELAGQPRAPLARRFGRSLLHRLDQVLGLAPEPVSPQREAPAFATRLTLPDPIGLIEDLLAGVDRLLPRLCETLRSQGRSLRALRLEAWRTDQSMQWVGLALARPSTDPDRIRPLLLMKLDQLEAGFGIDLLRLVATRTEASEPDPAGQSTLGAHAPDTGPARAELMARLGARIGLDTLTRHHPGQSHIPEKTALTLAAAWSEPPDAWPPPRLPRPLLLWPPEELTPEDTATPPGFVRWRRHSCGLTHGTTRERIAPEWWFADPDWHSGTRDYLDARTDDDRMIWLYHAQGATLPSGWHCHGSFG